MSKNVNLRPFLLSIVPLPGLLPHILGDNIMENSGVWLVFGEKKKKALVYILTASKPYIRKMFRWATAPALASHLERRERTNDAIYDFQVWVNLLSLFKKMKGVAAAARPGARTRASYCSAP